MHTPCLSARRMVPGAEVPLAFRHRRGEELHLPLPQEGKGPGLGIIGPDALGHLGRALGEVHPAVPGLHHGGIGDARLRLGDGGQGPGFQLFQGFHDGLAPDPGQTVVETAIALAGVDLGGHRQEHIPRVQPRVHLHDGDAALPVSVEDGRRDGTGPPPPGQEGCVDVETAVFGDVQHRLGENAAIGRNHDGVGLHFPQPGLGLRPPEIFRLEDGDAVFQSLDLHRRGEELHPPVFRGVHPGIDGQKLVPRIVQRFQRRHGEVRRSHKDQLHSPSPPPSSSGSR